MCISIYYLCALCVFFFNDTATTEIYTLSLHDALPIFVDRALVGEPRFDPRERGLRIGVRERGVYPRTQLLVVERSEEHTSELQSRQYLVCRLLLEKKKK